MSARRILVVDDDAGIRTVLAHALRRGGYDVDARETLAELLSTVRSDPPDLVLTDVALPDGSGLDALPRLKALRSDLPVIVMSAQNTFVTAITAAERGAYDYLPKPFDLDEMIGLVERALAEPRERAPTDERGEEVPLIGRSPAMQEVYRILARVMQTDLTVLITGESGTGKELVARALHDFGRRKNRPFVAVNMAAIPRELIETELFGHEKGAFTGAASRSAGRFEQAEGGTLFLDEIGDMPMEAQTRLLRVLQEREYTSVGGRGPRATDVRFVAATNQDLRERIDEGRFREDLYYRINVVPVRLPPLRERLQDVPELCAHFLKVAEKEGLPARSLSKVAVERLASHVWPGNVRELENTVRRLVVMSNDDVIDDSMVADELTRIAGPSPRNPVRVADLEGGVREFVARAFAGSDMPENIHAQLMAKVERPLFATVLAEVGGNQLKAAAILGLNRNTVRKRIRDLDVPVRRGKGLGAERTAGAAREGKD